MIKTLTAKTQMAHLSVPAEKDSLEMEHPVLVFNLVIILVLNIRCFTQSQKLFLVALDVIDRGFD